MPVEPNELTATEALASIRAGTLTSEALVRSCLARIEQREPDVRAWVNVDPEAAIAEAIERDAQPPIGPLHGLPVGFKDIIDTVDLPTEYGSSIYPSHQPAGDAACVALVRAAGGVVLGKTVTTEFAYVHPNKTRHPRNLAHTPGGSSSGSAASVADCMVPLAFGTQTGGSIIRPASFCGVVGYKPTFGQFSYAGVKLLAPALDTLGGMGRCVADIGLLRAAMLGAPTVETLGRAPRVALYPTPWWERADRASQQAVQRCAEVITNAGGDVCEVDLGAAFAELAQLNPLIMTYEGNRALAHEYARHADKLSDDLKTGMQPGQKISYASYTEALDKASRHRAHLAIAMADIDALLVPSAVGEAPVGFATTGDSIFNRAWTTIGVPCVTLPGAVGPNQLPVGVQFIGKPHDDDHLLSVAQWVEERQS